MVVEAGAVQEQRLGHDRCGQVCQRQATEAAHGIGFSVEMDLEEALALGRRRGSLPCLIFSVRAAAAAARPLVERRVVQAVPSILLR